MNVGLMLDLCSSSTGPQFDIGDKGWKKSEVDVGIMFDICRNHVRHMSKSKNDVRHMLKTQNDVRHMSKLN